MRQSRPADGPASLNEPERTAIRSAQLGAASRERRPREMRDQIGANHSSLVPSRTAVVCPGCHRRLFWIQDHATIASIFAHPFWRRSNHMDQLLVSVRPDFSPTREQGCFLRLDQRTAVLQLIQLCRPSESGHAAEHRYRSIRSSGAIRNPSNRSSATTPIQPNHGRRPTVISPTISRLRSLGPLYMPIASEFG